ncbi:TetR/AcrR family transcriptional regulator [Goekera deserti]|uniref:TetR/AcrR family transcriptional regulator n=1 Tax=Goekera deserti TaxID=2497753 RepID=UPI00192EEE53|nr:TetR/AcrR family transcriptional regulator [Goekera deserti]
MARTIDPVRYAARRLAIVDAALTRFAEDGFDRATTAAICRTAGIGSGTFFHYFPAKLDVLLAILELSTAETVAWFAAQQHRTDAAVLDDYVIHAAAGYADPRVAGFVKAVGAVMNDEQVAAALARDEAAVADGLLPWVQAAQSTGQVRVDVPAARLCAWVLVVLDGFLGRLATDTGFLAAAEQDMLLDTVRRVLAPAHR